MSDDTQFDLTAMEVLRSPRIVYCTHKGHLLVFKSNSGRCTVWGCNVCDGRWKKKEKVMDWQKTNCTFPQTNVCECSDRFIKREHCIRAAFKAGQREAVSTLMAGREVEIPPSSKLESERVSKVAADAIREDICGRRDGDHWFEGCAKDVQQEILDAWADIIRSAVSSAYTSGLAEGQKPNPCCKCQPPRQTKPWSLHVPACPMHLRLGDQKTEKPSVAVPQYQKLMEEAKDLWPRRADLNPRTAREDAMLSIMCHLIDTQTYAIMAAMREESEL